MGREGIQPQKEEVTEALAWFLETDGKEAPATLGKIPVQIKKQKCGVRPAAHGLVESSSYCSFNGKNLQAGRYRLATEGILTRADTICGTHIVVCLFL